MERSYRGSFKALLAAFTFMLALAGSAQNVASYTFAQGPGTYSNITGGTLLESGDFDNNVFTVSIPSFFFAGSYYNTMYVSLNGFITFGSSAGDTEFNAISSSDNYDGAISPFGMDLEDANSGTQSLRYQQVGSELVVQWRDVKRQSGTNSERFSFQARMNTSTGVIRFIYDAVNNPTSSTTSPQVGLRGPSNSFATNVKNRLVNNVAGSNTWATSANGTANNNTCLFTNGKVPAAGQTYTFTPPCMVPLATAGGITTNCGNGTFSFNVNVTGLGSAPNVDIVATPGGILHDNVGTGNYLCTLPNSGPVTITVKNNANNTCDLSLGSVQGNICLPDGVCGQNIAIPDNGCGSNEVSAYMTVAPGGTSLGTNVFLESVDLIVSHTNNTDLEIDLISPSGSVTRTLIADKFGSGDNLGNPASCPSAVLRFKDGGTALNTNNTNNVTGTFAPQQTLAGFNGQNPNGQWRLQVCDDASSNTGTIRYAKLNFQVCSQPNASAGTVVTNCSTNSFSVPVTVSNLGSAPNVDIVATPGGVLHDNVGTGTFTCGPFPSGTPVSITVVNNQNSYCNRDLGSFLGNLCLPDGTCGQNLAIPDDGCGTNELSAYIDVAPGGTSLGTNVFLESVDLIVSHTNNADIEIDLISPSGSVTRTLIADKFGSGDNLGNPANCPSAVLRFKDGGTALNTNNTSNVTGTFAPQQTLAGFNGQNPNGTWRLQVCDDNGGGTGAIRYVKLNFHVCSVPNASVGTVTTDCVSNTFSFPVTVSNLGSAPNVDVVATPGGLLHDDVGTGTYTCGPFPAGTSVSITVVNNQNGYCDRQLGSVQGIACMQNGVCTTPGPAIPDDGCSSGNNLDIGIVMSGLPTTLNVNSYFESIDLIVDHTWRGDLNMYLISPTGQMRNLFLRRPNTSASGNNLGDPGNCPTAVLKLKDGGAALSTLNAGTNNAAVGTFAPEQTLTGFTGNPNGTWILRVCDAAQDDAGHVRYVRLNILDCAPPHATATVVEDCANGVFRVSLNVTSTGSGNVVDLFSTVLGLEQSGVGTGTYLLGPYPIGTPVSIAVRHENNGSCDQVISNLRDCCGGVCSTALNAVVGTNTTSPVDCGDGASTGFGTRDARWYKWTAPFSGTITISSCGQSPIVDTYLRLHSGTCGSLTLLQQDDNGCGNNASRIQNRPVTAGITYYIEWDNRFSSSGFTWQLLYTVNGSTNPCAPIALACNDVRNATSTTGAPNTLPSSACPFNGPASTGGVHWWSYTAPADGEVIVTTCGNASFNTRLSVFLPLPSCTNPTCVAMNDDVPGCPSGTSEVSFKATAGQTYQIAVHGSGAAAGTYTISLYCMPVCTPAAGNDKCPAASAINSVLADGTALLQLEDNTCAHVDGPTSNSGALPVVGLWYSFNSGAHAMHRLHLQTSSENAACSAGAISYALFTGECSGLSAQGEISNVAVANGVNALPMLTANTAYRLLVYSSGGIGVAGTYRMLVDHPGMHDAGVIEVVSPMGTVCGDVITPVVILKNFGEAPLTDVVLQVSIDGGAPVLSYPWSGNLAIGASQQVTLPAVSTPFGTHNLQVSVLAPNGQPDEIAANNAANTNYDASGNPLRVVIRTDNFGAQISWAIYDAFFLPMATGGPYPNNTTNITDVCLSSVMGNCYSFFLFDSFGDGLCCSNGNGYWELRSADDQVLLGDVFASGPEAGQSPSATPASVNYVLGHEICLPKGPSNILETECGLFLNNLLNKVYCGEVAGVTDYQFEFSDPDEGFRRRIGVPRAWVKFGEIVTNPLLPGVHYFVRVRVDQGAPGFLDDHFGAGCEMGIDPGAVPGCTQLIDDPDLPTHSCGVTKTFGGSDKIWADPVVGGTLYKFHFSNPGEGYNRTIQRNNYVCMLNWQTLPLQNGSTYDVTVNVLVNGQWSGYCGAACQVTIMNPPMDGGVLQSVMVDDTEEMNAGSFTLYPNPVMNGPVSVRWEGLSEEQQNVQVDVFSMDGKRMINEQFAHEGSIFERVLDLDQVKETGVYLVVITAGDEVRTERLMIQR